MKKKKTLLKQILSLYLIFLKEISFQKIPVHPISESRGGTRSMTHGRAKENKNPNWKPKKTRKVQHQSWDINV